MDEGIGRIDIGFSAVMPRCIGGFAANIVGREHLGAGDGGRASGKSDSADKAGGKLG